MGCARRATALAALIAAAKAVTAAIAAAYHTLQSLELSIAHLCPNQKTCKAKIQYERKFRTLPDNNYGWTDSSNCNRGFAIAVLYGKSRYFSSYPTRVTFWELSGKRNDSWYGAGFADTITFRGRWGDTTFLNHAENYI